VSGNYSVIIYNNGCSKTSECMEYTATTSTKNFDFETEVTAFPNPTSDKIWIDLGKEYEDVTIRIYDILGQNIKTQKFDFIEKIETEWEGEAGIYQINIQNAEGKFITLNVVKI